jgi:hypothetical protein
MENKNCEHKKCYWEALTREWYFETVEREYCDPDVRAYGIKYCPWCGKELAKDGKTSS